MIPPVVSSVPELRTILDKFRHSESGNARRIALVPTLGALHAGHARLIERARAECDFVLVSIFVNPLQFGPSEDFQRYPRPIDKDLAICAEMGADLVFAPGTADMYAAEQLSFVEVTRVADHLCGAFRPGHFRGVATVVLKLFNIVQPDYAYFGEKDYQQLAVIRRMVDDFNVRVIIVAVPTLREPDGLALSSRNIYLDATQRSAAPALFRALTKARDWIESGEVHAEKIRAAAIQALEADPRIRVEYFEIVDPVEVQPVETVAGTVRIAAAIWIGRTRLIDNIEATLPMISTGPPQSS